MALIITLSDFYTFILINLSYYTLLDISKIEKKNLEIYFSKICLPVLISKEISNSYCVPKMSQETSAFSILKMIFFYRILLRPPLATYIQTFDVIRQRIMNQFDLRICFIHELLHFNTELILCNFTFHDRHSCLSLISY